MQALLEGIVVAPNTVLIIFLLALLVSGVEIILTRIHVGIMMEAGLGKQDLLQQLSGNTTMFNMRMTVQAMLL